MAHREPSGRLAWADKTYLLISNHNLKIFALPAATPKSKGILCSSFSHVGSNPCPVKNNSRFTSFLAMTCSKSWPLRFIVKRLATTLVTKGGCFRCGILRAKSTNKGVSSLLLWVANGTPSERNLFTYDSAFWSNARCFEIGSGL